MRTTGLRSYAGDRDSVSSVVRFSPEYRESAVRPSAQLAVLLLLCFQAVQQFLKRRDKWQAAVAGLRLCAILLDDLALAINGHLRDRMTNGDRLFLEVDSV